MQDPSAGQPISPLVPWIVAAAFFMQGLDSTIIVTALPAIARDFGVEPVSLSIGITAYLMALTVSLPAAGWLADRFGARTIFTLSVALFTLASLLCALAPSLELFVAARILQGIGGGLTAPIGRLVVLKNTRSADLLQAISTITWPALVAPVLGPPLGGLITEHASWQWIFLLNLPLGIAGVILAMRIIPQERDTVPRPFDVKGFLLVAAGLIALLWGLEQLAYVDGSPLFPLGFVAFGLALGWLAYLHLRGAPHPVLSLEPLTALTYRSSVIYGGFLIRIAISTSPFLLPLYFQLAWGLDSFSAGALVLFYMAGNLVMKVVTTRTIQHFGFRPVLVVNGLLVGVSIALTAILSPQTPYVITATVLMLSGLTRSMEFSGLSSLTFADVSPVARASATTLSSMMVQVAATLGIALAALTLSATAGLHGGAISTGDFQIAFVVFGLLGAGAGLTFLVLPRDAGAEISGKR
jgi:EmrB/QacA subfamily drug resistance transporter